jgi:hypothetical protein
MKQRQWLKDGLQDLAFAARLFRRKPMFAAIAAATLALGIGAATAVFSIMDAVLPQPLPYKDPGRLGSDLGSRHPRKRPGQDLRALHRLRGMAPRRPLLRKHHGGDVAYAPSRILTGRRRSQEVLTIPVSATFFDTLGVRAALGRTFTVEDERHGCAVVDACVCTDNARSGSRCVGR